MVGFVVGVLGLSSRTQSVTRGRLNAVRQSLFIGSHRERNAAPQAREGEFVNRGRGGTGEEQPVPPSTWPVASCVVVSVLKRETKSCSEEACRTASRDAATCCCIAIYESRAGARTRTR